MARYRCNWTEKVHYTCIIECEDEDYATDAIMARHSYDADEEPKLEKLRSIGQDLMGCVEHLDITPREKPDA